MGFEFNPADEDEHGECRHEIVKLRILLQDLHRWFLEKSPENYKGCGLYLDVLAELNGRSKV